MNKIVVVKGVWMVDGSLQVCGMYAGEGYIYEPMSMCIGESAAGIR